MSANSAALVVAGVGEIYVNATDTAEPTTYPYTGWTDLGHTSVDGLTLNFEMSTESLSTWRQLGAVRTAASDLTFEVSFTAHQVDEATLDLYFGTLDGLESVSDRFQIAKSPTPQPKALVVRMVDGADAWSFYAPSVEFRSGGEMEATREGLLTLPLVATVLGSDAYTYLATFGGPALIEA